MAVTHQGIEYGEEDFIMRIFLGLSKKNGHTEKI